MFSSSMSRTARVVAAIVVAVYATVTFPSPASAADGGSPRTVESSLPKDLFEKTVRTAYKSLEDYTAQTGAGIRFEVDHVRTYLPEDFDRVRVIDVATMPEGRVIDVVHSGRTTDHASGARTRQVEYRASWRTQDPNWRAQPETIEGMERSLEEVLPLMAEQNDARFRHVAALTLYDVTATLGDESRTYHAGVYWFRDEGATDWKKSDLLVIDHITQGVEMALREDCGTDEPFCV